MRMRARYVTVQHASGRSVAERWEAQYLLDGTWKQCHLGDSKKIYDDLCALGPTPDIAKVAEIIGNKSWSYITCAGCRDYVERAVAIGGDYEEPHAYCATCIAEAHAILLHEDGA